MKIAIDLLREYTELPADPREVRNLFDDVGLEVKRREDTALGPVFTLELLANRGDHHAYHGIAREVSGRTGAAVRMPGFQRLDAGPSPIPVRVETELCLRYTVTLLEKQRHAGDASPSPVLVAAGLDAVHPAVDATNQVNLEIGQPTHAFDADRIEGAITVRVSRPGERAWPLFRAEPTEIPAGTLVIADERKILAIAGVIGCEDSKTTDATTRIVLESATFDPVAVRKARRALDLHTDASARFERGADPSLPLVAAGRVAELLAPHGWHVVGQSGVCGGWSDPARTIALRPEAARRFLDLDLPDDAIAERLRRYGFVVEPGAELRVRVPPHRLWDVEFAADLFEELAKSIGYNNTPVGLPPVDMGAQPSAAETARRSVDEVLLANGFYEVFTDGFHGRDLRERLGITEDHPLWAHVETANALDRGYSLLKNSAFGQAVETIAVNLRQQRRETRAFEWTRTFHPDPSAENGLCSERKLMWAIACGPSRTPDWSGQPAAFGVHHARGLIEEMALAAGVELMVQPLDTEEPLAKLLHPHRAASILQGGRRVGVFGEVHPRVCGHFKIKRERPVYLELDAAAFTGAARPHRFIAPSDIRPVERNLAFTLPLGVTADQVGAAIRVAGPGELTRVRVTDRFDHERDGIPVRTLTWALEFDATERALTGDEVNRACEAIIAAVEGAFADQGVRLRA